MKSPFYGWLTLASAFVIFAVVTIGVNGLPLLNVSLKEMFQWTHQQITLGPSALYFIVAVVSPFAGALADRFGPRLMMTIGSLLTVAALALYPYVTQPWHLVGIYVLCAVSITLGGAIAGVTLLSYWFNKYRGVAVGVYLVGSSLGGIVFPQLIAYLTETNGWQQTAVLLAIVAAVCAAPPLLLIRNHPSEKNAYPDGIANAAPTDIDARVQNQGLTLADALASPMFYLVLYITAAVFFCITGVVQNFALFMRDIGLDNAQTANALSLFFICSIAGKIVFGALSDRFAKKNILVAALINMTIGSMLMRLIPSNSAIFLPLFAVVYGLGYSGAFTMVQLTVAAYYAGKNFGKILGLVTTMDTLAGSAGIYLLSGMRTAHGDYLTGIHVLIGVSISAVLCALLIHKPTPATVNQAS